MAEQGTGQGRLVVFLAQVSLLFILANATKAILYYMKVYRVLGVRISQ